MNSSNLNRTFDGRLAEQFVGQELLAESLLGSEGRNLYYWAREAKSSTAEVDYLVARQGKVFPLEVKAGKSGSLKSLHRYLQEFGGEGVVLQRYSCGRPAILHNILAALHEAVENLVMRCNFSNCIALL